MTSILKLEGDTLTLVDDLHTEGEMAGIPVDPIEFGEVVVEETYATGETIRIPR